MRLVWSYGRDSIRHLLAAYWYSLFLWGMRGGHSGWSVQIKSKVEWDTNSDLEGQATTCVVFGMRVIEMDWPSSFERTEAASEVNRSGTKNSACDAKTFTAWQQKYMYHHHRRDDHKYAKNFGR